VFSTIRTTLSPFSKVSTSDKVPLPCSVKHRLIQPGRVGRVELIQGPGYTPQIDNFLTGKELPYHLTGLPFDALLATVRPDTEKPNLSSDLSQNQIFFRHAEAASNLRASNPRTTD